MLEDLIKFFERISTRIDPIADLYTKLIVEEMVIKEAKMAHIFPNDEVLHIGCGPVPHTSITIARETGAEVTAIDNDLGAVGAASLYIHNKGLSKKIKVEKGDGMDYPISRFDAIFVSRGIEPRNEVLKKIFDSMKINARLIYRKMPGDDEIFLDKFSKSIRQPFFTLTKSFLMVKGKNGANKE